MRETVKSMHHNKCTLVLPYKKITFFHKKFVGVWRGIEYFLKPTFQNLTFFQKKKNIN